MKPALKPEFATRHAHQWLGAMLLALHAAVAWDMQAAWAQAFLLAHFGLFLLWQPLLRGERNLHWSQALWVVVIGLTLVLMRSAWLIAAWLTLLTALIGGHVPGAVSTGSRWARVTSLLAALYLLSLLLIWVAPHLAGDTPRVGLQANLVRYGLPVLPLAILLIRTPPAPLPLPTAPRYAVDPIYSLMLLSLVAVLVLGSIVILQSNAGEYLVALALALLITALALFGLSWLMTPTAGFAGLRELFSQYLLSVGLPFESWVQELATMAERESDPARFLEAALEHLRALPWVMGLRWETPRGAGHHGRLNEHYADYTLEGLQLRIHSRWAWSPSMLLHAKLLAQMAGHFYAAKMREAAHQQDAYTQAIHETGSRLTHDVKNLLQSLHVLTAAASDSAANTPESRDALIALVQRQLPRITERLDATLEKMRAPEVTATPPVSATVWWNALTQRYAWRNVGFTLASEANGQLLAAELFDNVADNLIENALRKTSTVNVHFDPGALTLTVTDNGEAIPSAIARSLFNAPLPSASSLGVGLYHAAQLAAQYGYSLTLAANEAANVKISLAPINA